MIVDGTTAMLAHLDGLMAERAVLRERANRWDEWKRDPITWASERGKSFLWSKQREIFDAVAENRRTAVKSCHSVGKTFTVAHIAGWWIDCHEPGTAFVVTTAPSGAQVKALLWREINRLHVRAGLPGRTNLTEWYVGKELVAFGRKPSDYNEHSFQGLHAQYVLVLLDEACGIPTSLWVAAESIASNTHSRIVAIGNPDDNDSQFAHVCRYESPWHVIKIGYEDTPAWTGEDVPDYLHDLLISREWVEERRQDWGEDSALFTSKCMGEFPDRTTDAFTVVPLAMATRCRWLELEPGEPVEAGVDVGATGDSTVVYERRGRVAGRVVVFNDADPMATVARIAMTLEEWGVTRVKVDSTGLGWGIAGRLREISAAHNARLNGDATHHAEVIAVNFAQRARDPRRFLNRRAEMWWRGRELSRLGQWDLGTLDEATLAELCTPRYEILDSTGKLKIEPKDEVRARLGKSPDRADALLLAFDEAPQQLADTSALDVFAGAQLLPQPPASQGPRPGAGLAGTRGGAGFFGR